jgi:hypothetical protein
MFRYNLEGPQTLTIFTDYKPLVTFYMSNTDEIVYVRRTQILRALNIKIVYIEGTKHTAADSFSLTIYDLLACTPMDKVHLLYEVTKKHD